MEDFAKPMMHLERELFNGSDGILSISDAISTKCLKDYGIPSHEMRIEMVPIGLEDPRASGATLPQPGQVDAVRVVFVGRLEQRKGIDVLLEAAKTLLPRYAELSFDLVGDDSIEDSTGRTFRESFTAEYGSEPWMDRVRFRGEVSDAELRGFYRTADIVVAPSRFESFGIVALEAMSEGKPVIGCRTGGMVEVIEDEVSGLLAEPGDTETLQSAIARLVSDRGLRSRLGDQGRSLYESKFTADRMADRVIEFLTSISESRPSETEPPSATRVGL